MKNLKLIALIMFIANITIAQTNYSAPGSVTGVRNTIIGEDTGTGASGGHCTFVGYAAGVNSNAWNNTFVGANAGKTSTGEGNLAFGAWALGESGAGRQNIAIGNNASRYAKGSYNISIGANAGEVDATNSGNTYIGYNAGVSAIGNNNLFLGSFAGSGLTNANNKLYIDNSGDENGTYVGNITTPLIYGDFTTHQVGIGTNDVGIYTLAVKGHMVAEEITVKTYDTNTGWADYVFEEDYDLMPLTELEKEIEKLGHLPEVPSAEEVNENGYKVGEMDVTLLKKVEELTLHLIEMDKAIKALQQSEKELNEENAALKTELSTSTEQKRTPRKKRGTKK